MILCSCCENRIGHSLEKCTCAAEYCPVCLRCDAHCQCDKSAGMSLGKTPRAKRSAAKSPGKTGGGTVPEQSEPGNHVVIVASE